MRVHTTGCGEHGAFGLDANGGDDGVGEWSLLSDLCELHEVGAQGMNATLHQSVVHIGVGTAVVLVDEAGFRCCVEFLLQGIAGQMSKEIGDGGRWDELGRLDKHSLSHQAAHRGGTNGCLFCLQSGNLFQTQAVLRQLFGQ